MNTEKVEARPIASQFKCLADQVRLDILAVLLRAARPVSTGEIIATTHYCQSSVWKHLQRLCTAGLAQRRGDCYVADVSGLHSIVQAVESMASQT